MKNLKNLIPVLAMAFAIMGAFAFNTTAEESDIVTGLYRATPEATVCDQPVLCSDVPTEFFCEVGIEQAYEDSSCLTPLYRID